MSEKTKYHKNERHLSFITHSLTKLSQNECLFNTHIYYIGMPDVTASSGRSFDFIAFFGYFHTLLTSIHVQSIVSSPNFHRLCVQSPISQFQILVCQHAKFDWI